MTLPTIDQARSWRGLTLVASNDESVGKIEAIYVDRTTRQPEMATVNMGLFGSSLTFVPLYDAAQHGDTVQVPYEPSVIREAPRPEGGADLSEEDEARLYAHYGIEYTPAESPPGLEEEPSESTADQPVIYRNQVEWLPDAPASRDLLHRRPLAMALATRLRRMHDEEPSTSFLVHIDGPWGSGKSTLLNFVRAELGKEWLTVDFDA